MSRLADVDPMSFAAVQEHVAVLERAGLVTKERRGPTISLELLSAQTFKSGVVNLSYGSA